MKTIKVDFVRHDLWERILSGDVFITVKSTKYNSCLSDWVKHKGFHPVWCRGCGSRTKDLVGRYVIKVNSSDRKWYSVPLCSSCNNSAPFEFKVKLKDLDPFQRLSDPSVQSVKSDPSVPQEPEK